MTLHALPQDTVRLIKSTQVITTPASIVKELVENSFDAESTTVSIKVENHGFSRLEVRDNGTGVHEDDVKFIAKPHYTSKISSFSDLACLTTYGFRGEALASLCTVAEVIITTKTKESPMGHMYLFDNEGNVKEKKPAATPNGTTVVVSNLFKNVPVRRQFFSNPKRCREEFKKLEDLVLAFSLAVPNVHLTLYHDKSIIIQKNSARDLRTALMNTFPAVFKDFVSKIKLIDDIKLEVHLPSARCLSNQNFSRVTADRLFVMVNQRPVMHKTIEKLVKAHYSQKMEGCHGRYPIGIVVLTLPLDAVDVNLEPNKTKVLLKDEEIVLESLKEMLTELYGPVENKQKSDGKKEPKACSAVNTQVTCTLSCISQPPKNKHSYTFKKSHHSQERFSSSHMGVENLLLKDEVMEDSLRLNGQKVGNLKPKSPQLFVRDEVVEKVDQYFCKQNITNVKQTVITSTPHSEDQEFCPSVSESIITHDGELRHCVEETDTDLDIFSSKDAHILSSDEQNISGIEPLSNSNLCNNAINISKPKTSEQSLDKPMKHNGTHNLSSNKQNMSCIEPLSISSSCDVNEKDIPKSKQSNELIKPIGISVASCGSEPESNLLHESLLGSDGIPVFRIAALPSEELQASFMNDQPCQVSGTEKENVKLTHLNICYDEKDREQKTNSRESFTALKKSSCEEESLNPSIASSTEKSTGGYWSRGLTTTGANIQTVQLVNSASAEGRVPNRKLSLGSDVRKRAPVELQGAEAVLSKKPKLDSLKPSGSEYIHGKQVKKPSSPFILFSRDVRSQVLSENPGADFAFIAKELAERWKALDHETKCCYNDQAKLEMVKYQEEVRKIRENRGLNTSFNSPSKKIRMTKASLDRYIAPMTPQLSKNGGKYVQKQPLVSIRSWRERSLEIHITIDKIKEVLKSNPPDINSGSLTTLLGPLTSCGGWLCLRERNIIGLNTFRLHETVLVNSLMKTFCLPVKDLTDFIPFNASTLGIESWKLLLKLHREMVPDRNMYIVKDLRFAYNGFKIALYPGTNSSNPILTHGEIIGMTDAVGYYGINDFKELLSSLVAHPSATIDQTRPLKLQHWIKVIVVAITW
nr:mismatch repair endonuclease pms1-like [Cherax quadricarinatus]